MNFSEVYEKFDKGLRLTDDEIMFLCEAFDQARKAIVNIYIKEYRLVYVDICKNLEVAIGYAGHRGLIKR